MDLLTADCHGAQSFHIRHVHIYTRYNLLHFDIYPLLGQNTFLNIFFVSFVNVKSGAKHH